MADTHNDAKLERLIEYTEDFAKEQERLSRQAYEEGQIEESKKYCLHAKYHFYIVKRLKELKDRRDDELKKIYE